MNRSNTTRVPDELQAGRPKRAHSALSASRFPSPRPSPLGRGRIVGQSHDEKKRSRVEPLNRSGRHPACRRAGASSPAEKAAKQSTRRNGWQQVRAAGCQPSTAGRMPSATWWFVGRGNRGDYLRLTSIDSRAIELHRCLGEREKFSRAL